MTPSTSKLVVTWENDSATLPQFAATIMIHNGPDGGRKLLEKVKVTDPHATSAEIVLPAKVDAKKLSVQMQCRDILDNESPALLLGVGD